MPAYLQITKSGRANSLSSSCLVDHPFQYCLLENAQGVPHALTHLAFVKECYDFLVELLLEFLLRIHIVAVPLKQMRCTWLVRPLA